MCAVSSVPVMAQFNLKKAISGAVKATQAVTLTDEQMGEYVKRVYHLDGCQQSGLRG